MQIPTSASIATKAKWIKYTLKGCDKTDGVYDKTSDTIINKATSWTVYVKDWQSWRAPSWVGRGYYAQTALEKQNTYTIAVGDLIVFDDVDDVVPSSVAEFNALVNKYKNNGGAVTSSEAFINYNGSTPWKTNHIEAVRG